MKFLVKPLNFTVSFKKAPCRGALKSSLSYLWNVYSKPTPAGREVFTLLSLCFLIAMATGGLLYHWLSVTLKYDHNTAFPTAAIYSVTIFLVSFLCHPLRCVLALALPSLGSKQGRKLIISTSLMILVLNVIPNITMNIGAVTHVLKCTSEGFARTLLNSSGPFNKAKTELVDEIIKVNVNDLNLINSLKEFSHFTQIDISMVKKMFKDMIGGIESNFSNAKDLLNGCKLVLNRILAAMFVGYLILESVRYLKSYLTSVRFDNANLSKELLQKASDEGILISPDHRRNMIHSKSCKITSEEAPSFFISLTVVTLYFIAMTFIIVLDHIVYHLVQMSLPWLLDFPPTTASLSVDFKVQGFIPALCILKDSCRFKDLSNFHRAYEWTFSPQPSRCYVQSSAPDLRVTLLLGFLWLVGYIMVFLEVYARRIRRSVSASFFRAQEEKRVAFLLKKIQAKRKRRDIDVYVVNGTKL